LKERCLKLLNLPITANKGDIKKAFRALAFEYHPDRNPSKEAQEKFIEITRAYDFLMSDQSSRLTHIFKQTTAPKEPVNQEKNEQAWFKKYQKEVAEKRQKDGRVYEKIKNSFLYKVSKICALFSSIITVMLLLNYMIIGAQRIEVKVVDVFRMTDNYAQFNVVDVENNKEHKVFLITENQYSFFKHIENGYSIYLNKTWIFNDILNVEYTTNNSTYTLDNRSSISTFYGLYLLIFIPFLGIYFMEGQNLIYTMAIDGKTIITSIVILVFFIQGFYFGLFKFF
jgi:uncharacterized protein YsxB (DUF464 family)